MNRRKLFSSISMIVVMVIVALSLITACAAPSPSPSPAPAPAPPTPAPAPSPTQEVYHWKMQTAIGAAETEQLCKPWADMIEKASNGRIKIDVFADCEIVPTAELLDAVARGTVDIAIVSGSAQPEPDIAGLLHWFAYGWLNPLENAVQREERGLMELAQEAYAEQGVHYIYHYLYDPTELITTKPIYKYEDLKGLKIMAFAPLAPVWEKAGAAIVVMPIEGAYLAGTTGIIDGVIWGGSYCYSLMGFQEAFPYMLTNSEVYPASDPMIINMDLWNSLPEDLQTIIELSARAVSWETATIYYSEEGRNKANFICTTFSKEDELKLMANADEYWEEYAQRSPRCAKAVAIIRAYRDEVEAQGWFR